MDNNLAHFHSSFNAEELADYLQQCQVELPVITILRDPVDIIQKTLPFKMEDSEKYKSFCSYCSEGNIERAEKMLRSGEIDLNRNCSENETNPLLAAVKSENLEMVKILLEFGAKVNVGSPLHLACEKGNFEIAELLLNSGADANSLDKDNQQPLHYAFWAKNHFKIIELLLKHGTKLDDNKYLSNGCDILQYFEGNFEKEDCEIVKLLVEHKTVSMQYVLTFAVFYNNISLLKFLIDYGVDMNSTLEDDGNESGSRPLASACHDCNVEMVELFLKNGADPNKLDEYNGRTPLVIAGDEISIMKLLLKFGADINGQDELGNTALHYCRYRDIFKFLLSRGIDPAIKNNNDETAREFLHDEELLEYYEDNMNEIAKMKSIVLNSYGLTLHDVMLMNRNELSLYINNVNLRNIFEDAEFSEKFLNFGDVLKEKLIQGEERKKLMNLASESLNNLAGVKIPELILSELFKYFSDGELTSTFLKISKK